MVRKGQSSGEFRAEGDATMLAHQALSALLRMMVMIGSRPSLSSDDGQHVMIDGG